MEPDELKKSLRRLEESLNTVAFASDQYMTASNNCNQETIKFCMLTLGFAIAGAAMTIGAVRGDNRLFLPGLIGLAVFLPLSASQRKKVNVALDVLETKEKIIEDSFKTASSQILKLTASGNSRPEPPQ